MFSSFREESPENYSNCYTKQHMVASFFFFSATVAGFFSGFVFKNNFNKLY